MTNARAPARPTSQPIGAIVLAAGRSQRMQALGTPKQLLPLAGRPLITYAVGAICASAAAPVVIVLGAEAAPVQAALDAWAAMAPTVAAPTVAAPTAMNEAPAGSAVASASGGRYQCVVNSDFAQGMASSLRVGLAALRAQAPQTPGALIALADQPLVTPAIITALLATAQTQPGAIIAASYDGQRGHPIIFPSDLFDELAQVTGDEGGRSVIARHADRLHLVAIADSRAALDVDRPEDYATIRAWFA